ncbi:hypothetical protein QL285_081714 [Trifolium repens]|jgi:hypothetical protein|nr:hypothetical protein QL285_081714 [Trifolium repens]
MRNEEIVEALRAMEESFKQNYDSQQARFTASLIQYMASTDARLITELTKNNNRRLSNQPLPSSDITAVMKTLCLDVPHFDEKGVEDWIYKINKLFTLHRLTTESCLTMVSFHLDDKASSWFQWMEKSGAISNWDDFLREVQKCFGPSVYED